MAARARCGPCRRPVCVAPLSPPVRSVLLAAAIALLVLCDQARAVSVDVDRSRLHKNRKLEDVSAD